MIQLDNVTIQAGEFRLPDMSFCIESGTYAVLMGKTGIGKTTILEAICGLRRIVSGRVLIEGHDVTSWQPADRNLGYVPQDLALFPTLTVGQHLEFATRIRGFSGPVRIERAQRLADLLGIKHLLSRRVHGLSGGEAQRVALGRALSFQPCGLLLDEPLSALDSETRGEAMQMLKSIHQATGISVIHVTHNADEAECLADRHLRLIADPKTREVELVEQPVNLSKAGPRAEQGLSEF